MTTDLERQVREYVQHVDSLVQLTETEELTTRAEEPGLRRIERRAPGLRRAPGWVVAAAAAAVTVLAIGGALWLVRSAPGEDAADRTEVIVPPAPSDLAPMSPVTEAPVPTTSDALTEDSSDGVIDYEANADLVGTMNVSLGSIEWWWPRSVPAAWLEQGFPSFAFTWPRSWISLYEEAPQGVEIFEVESGYVGLQGDVGDEIAERRREWVPQWDGYGIMPESVWFSADGESWELMAEGPIEATREPYVASTMHDPYVLTERDGRFVLVGWADTEVEVTVWDDEGNALETEGGHFVLEDLFDSEGNPVDLFDDEGNPADLFDGEGNRVAAVHAGGDPVDWVNDELVPVSGITERGTPMAWVSEDLVTWTRVTADFEKSGMRTDLSSVVGTDAGWFIFGVRRTDASDPLERRVAEWAAWVSTDGYEWEEFPIQDLLGAPETCTPTMRDHCIRIKGEPAPGGGVAVYAYEWDHYAPDLRQYKWKLLVGLPG